MSFPRVFGGRSSIFKLVLAGNLELVLPAFALGTGAVPTDGAARFHFHKTLIGPRVLVLGEVTPPATFLPHSLLVGWELEKPILE